MPPYTDFRQPLLNYVDSENKQQLVSDDSVTQLVSSKDAEFNSVSISGLDADRTTVLDRTRHITSDETSTYISGTLNVSQDISVQGSVFNIEAETRVADSFLVEQSGGP